MRSAHERRKVENVAQAVEETKLQVVPLRRVNAFKVEADVLQQIPREDDQKIVNLRFVDVEHFSHQPVIRFHLEVVENEQPSRRYGPHQELSMRGKIRD